VECSPIDPSIKEKEQEQLQQDQAKLLHQALFNFWQ
jgi:hypothetical protein